MATIDDLKKIEIRAGKIISADPIEGSEKLLKLRVSFGQEGERQVVSGIARHFPEPSALIGKKCAFVCNLEPRQIMGLESQAMILATGEGDSFSLLNIEPSVEEGSLIR